MLIGIVRLRFDANINMYEVSQMRTITIIGAGQAGLQLGIGLLGFGYTVNIVTNKTAAEVRAGNVISSQSMYDMALNYERELGISFWDESCPPIEGVYITAGSDEDVFLNWGARMSASGQSVDQRIKMPAWMDEFQRRGGNLIIEEADVEALERYAKESDLVVVASGKGDVGKLFERDEDLSPVPGPLRTISLSYVHGMLPLKKHSGLNINLHPGVGEYTNFPALTHSGPCDIINLECVIGGPMDCWHEVKSPSEHLELAVELIRKYFPWEAWRCENLSLTDDGGILVGKVPPTVRKPVGVLPSGRTVMGMADVVVLNDPMAGQGSNNASKSANMYMKAIVQHADKPFDDVWKQQLFNQYWEYAQWVTRFSVTHLLPLTEAQMQVQMACAESPVMASLFADAFNDPASAAPWYYDVEEGRKFIEQVAQRQES